MFEVQFRTDRHAPSSFEFVNWSAIAASFGHESKYFGPIRIPLEMIDLYIRVVCEQYPGFVAVSTIFAEAHVLVLNDSRKLEYPIMIIQVINILRKLYLPQYRKLRRCAHLHQISITQGWVLIF